MRDFLGVVPIMARVYGGPLLVLLAVVLGILALAFHVRAPWFLWAILACAASGVGLLAWLLADFRGLRNM